MATLQRVDSANFISGAIGLVPPVSRALAGIFILGGSLELSRRNLAPGAAGPGTIVGAPTVEAGYITTASQSHYIDSGIAETNAMTLIVVARAPLLGSSNRPGLIGNYLNSPASGAAVYIDGTTGTGFPIGAPKLNVMMGTLVSQSLTDPDSSAWGYYEGSVFNGAGTILRERTAGVASAAATTATTRVRNTASNIRIGSMAHPSFTGNADISLAIIHADTLTTAEAAANYAWAQAVTTKRLAVTI